MLQYRRTVVLGTLVAAALAAAPAARAHFLWVTVLPGKVPAGASVQAFFNENPEPDANFLKYVREVRLTVANQPIPSDLSTDSRRAAWAGPLPALVDSELDFGVTSRGEKAFRLRYTARGQSAPVASGTPESLGGLRVRLLEAGGSTRDVVEVLFDGKPTAGARIKVYPAKGEPTELSADAKGMATVTGLSEGKASLWANRIEPAGGTLNGKAYSETRHYATLTYTPGPTPSEGQTTTFATMPEAVTSLGAAVLGKWLYVYGGHLGKVHVYNAETTSRHFRRLNLEDGKTWEELPMGPDLQGLPLVTDGKALYRVGGMSARNKPGADQDMHSVADFSRYDVEARRWSSLPPMPGPRSTHDAAIIGRTLYVVGGWKMEGETEESTFLDHALAIDLDHPTAGWRVIPQPFRRRALAAAAFRSKLYVLGGLVDGGMKVERRVDVYDPEKKTWGRGPDLPGGLKTEGFGSSAYELDGRLYVSGASGRIHRLSEGGDAWEAVGAWSQPRITHRLLPAPGQRLLAVGGAAKGQPTSLIEAVRLVPPTSTRVAEAAAGR